MKKTSKVAKKPSKKEVLDMPVSQTMKFGEELGAEIAAMVNTESLKKSLKKANLLLNKYGYSVDISLNFYKLPEE
jgi:hypothetical protein